jgi:hypothetical protein
VHIRYDYTGCQSGLQVKEVRLDVQQPDGTSTTLVPFAPPDGFEGTQLHFVPTSGFMDIYTYYFMLKLQDDSIVRSYWPTLDVVFDGWIGGTLEFNEMIDDLPPWMPEAELDSIAVPAGFKLTLGPVKLSSPTSCTNCGIYVYGQFEVSPLAELLTSVYAYVPLQINPPPLKSKFYFMPGSAGSTIRNGEQLKAHVATGDTGNPVTISDVVSATVSAESGNARVTHIDHMVLSGAPVVKASRVGSIEFVDPPFTGEIEAESALFYSPAGTLTDNARLRLTKCDLEEIGLDLKGAAQLEVEDSTLGVVSLSITQTTSLTTLGRDQVARAADGPTLTIRNSRIRRKLTLSGGKPELTRNQIYGSVVLEGRSEAVIQDNVFVGQLSFQNVPGHTWGAAGGPEPIVSNNSFVGPWALGTNFVMTRTVSIGSNYYGDAGGPELTYVDHAPDAAFLGPRGARVQMSYLAAGLPHGFDLEPPNPSGKFLDDSGTFPQFWLQGYVIGQNVLTHRPSGVRGAMQLDKETLVSLDIVTSDESVSGAQVYAEFAGKRIDAPQIRFHRDRSAYTSDDQYMARSTANIILPPVSKNPGGGTQLLVYMDVSAVPGGDFGRPVYEPILLVNEFLAFDGPPNRPVRIAVQPMQFYGFCSGKGNATTARDNLRNDLPAMTMLRPKDLTLDLMPRVSFFCGPVAAASGTALAMEVGADIAIGTALGQAMGNAGTAPLYDRIVAVVPNGFLGSGIDGTNAPGSRNVVIVDEASPNGALHELGHSIGLYISLEEYFAYPPDGLPVSDLTAFAPVGRTGFAGDRGRITHFPYPTDLWARSPDVYDIMGAVPSVWPLKPTSIAFNGFFIHLPLPLADRPSSTVPAPSSPDDDSWRHMFISALIEPDPAGGGLYRMRSETISLFDLGSYAVNPPSGQGNTVCNWYRLRYYDAGDAILLDFPFCVHPPDAAGRPVYEFAYWYTFGVPDSAQRLAITHDGDNQVVFERRRASSLDTPFLSPAPGSTLGETMTLSWPATSQPVLRYIWFSGDGGAHWLQALGTVGGNSWTLPSDFLTASDQVSLRVFTSDGFRMSEARVDGLHMPNRIPVVAIVAPSEGAKAVPGTRWTLSALVTDLDGPVEDGEWVSSRDGSLGYGSYLETELSTGDHTLTYLVTDGSASASAAVHVSVGPVPTVDLALPVGALEIWPARRDPSNTRPVTLTTGVSNTLFLNVQGGGAAVTATVALSVTAPGGNPVLLGRAAVPLEPFATAGLGASYTPLAAGDYRFAARIEESTLPDPDPANNEREWVYSTGRWPSPPWRFVSLPLVLR